MLAMAVCCASAVMGDPALPPVDSDWPGVKFQITQVLRVDPAHVLMVVHIIADSSAPASTFLGYLPAAGMVLPKDPSFNDINSGKYLPKPFLLKDSFIFNEKTKEKFPAEPRVPNQPYFGDNEICTPLLKGGWIQLAVMFKAPPESVPTADEAAPSQPKVDVYLPKAKLPIRNVELPKLAATPPPGGQPIKPQ
jgi:hypothetical protein